MAMTRASVVKSVFGNQRVEHFVVTADATSGAVSTGLGVIDAVLCAPKSMASAPYAVEKNQTTDAASSNGSVYFTGVASGDDLHVTVFGR